MYVVVEFCHPQLWAKSVYRGVGIIFAWISKYMQKYIFLQEVLRMEDEYVGQYPLISNWKNTRNSK